MPVDIDMDIDLDDDFDWNSILFEMPEPELHQIVGSLCVHPNPKDELAQIFGEPEETKGGWKFTNGLRLSKYNNVFRYVVSFVADDEIFAGLAKFLEPYPPMWSGTLIAQIIKAEVKWDVPCPNMTDKEIERLLWEIGEITIPQLRLPQIEYIRKAGRKKRISREIVNGRRTVYFNPMHLGKDRKYILIKKPSWKFKIYIKELSGVRHIRFEVTLSKNYLKSKRMPKTIPTTTKPSWLERIKMEDFITFAKVDWERLAQEAHKRMRAAEEASQRPGQRFKRPHPYRVLIAAGRNLPACRQKHAAYGMFRLIKKGRLREDFAKGKYQTPIKLFKE